MRALTRRRWRPLGGASGADFVAAVGQDHVVEGAARQQRACRRHPEAHGDGDRLVILVVLGDHLPHVRARRDLEGADVAPAEVHAVVAEVGAAAEIFAGHAPDARADGELGLELGVARRHDELVDVLRVLDDHRLARRFVLGDLDGRQRVGQRMGQAHRPVLVILPAEHLVDDIDVAEQIGDDPVIGAALDVVEKRRASSVHMLLQGDDFEVGIDLLVALDQVPLGLEPFEGPAKIRRELGRRAGNLFFRYRHCSSPSDSQVRYEPELARSDRRCLEASPHDQRPHPPLRRGVQILLTMTADRPMFNHLSHGWMHLFRRRASGQGDFAN